MNSLSWVISAFAIFTLASAENGRCRFEEGKCSCKVGESNQGICWDTIPGSDPLKCIPRPCKKGWTCSCANRTHLCALKATRVLENSGEPLNIEDTIQIGATKHKMITSNINIVSHFLANSKIGKSSTRKLERSCKQKDPSTSRNIIVGVAVPEIELGSVRIGISERGTAANQCTHIHIYVNGEHLNEYSREAGMNGKKAKSLVKTRAYHSKLELHPGDVLAFNFKQASYYCYKHVTDFSVTGIKTSSNNAGSETRFARSYTPGWQNKAFRAVLDDTERPNNKASFVSLRAKTSGGTTIKSGIDYWESPNKGKDHEEGDFYFRVNIPASVSK